MVWSVLCNSKSSWWVEPLRFPVRQESEGTKSTILAQSENLQLENDTLNKIYMQNIIVKDKHKKCAWSIFNDLLFLIRSASLNFSIKKVCYLFTVIFTAILIHHFYYHFNSKWNRLSHFSVVAIEVHQIRAYQQEKECLEQFSMWAICKLFWLLFLDEVSCSSCIAFM